MPQYGRANLGACPTATAPITTQTLTEARITTMAPAALPTLPRAGVAPPLATALPLVPDLAVVVLAPAHPLKSRGRL